MKIYTTGYGDRGTLGQNEGITGTTIVTSFAQEYLESNDWEKAVITSNSLAMYAIDSDGGLYACGNNNDGELGQGDTTHRDILTRIGTDTWIDVSCGFHFAMGVKSDGTLWGWGQNFNGELCQGSSGADELSPIQVGSASDWVSVACYGSITYAINTAGEVYKTNLSTDLLELYDAGPWSYVTANSGFEIGIQTDGTLWGLGDNSEGQLGLGSGNPTIAVWTQIGSESDWETISAGARHTIGRRSNNTVWGSGRSNDGQLGSGRADPEYTHVQLESGTEWLWAEAGDYTTHLISTDATLKASGLNSQGQLGTGDQVQKTSFTEVTVTGIVSPRQFISSGTMTILLSASTKVSPGRHLGVAGIDGGIHFAGKPIIGDKGNGKIYYLDMDAYTDDGKLIVRTRRAQVLHKDRVNVMHTRLEVEFEAGVGLNVASGVDGEDPQALLNWSDDGGKTFNTQRSVDIGTYQEYTTRAIWRQLGKSRNRIYQLQITDPVKIVIIGAYGSMVPCKY